MPRKSKAAGVSQSNESQQKEETQTTLVSFQQVPQTKTKKTTKKKKTVSQTRKTRKKSEKLRGTPEESVAQLSAWCKDEHPENRIRAVRALTHVHNLFSLDLFLSFLSDPDPHVQKEAERAAIMMIERATGILREGIRARNPFIYESAKLSYAQLMSEYPHCVKAPLQEKIGTTQETVQRTASHEKSDEDAITYHRAEDIRDEDVEALIRTIETKHRESTEPPASLSKSAEEDVLVIPPQPPSEPHPLVKVVTSAFSSLTPPSKPPTREKKGEDRPTPPLTALQEAMEGVEEDLLTQLEKKKGEK